MSHCGLIITLWVLGFLTPSVQTEGQAKHANLSGPSLKGLAAFNVVVEQLGPKIEGKGLTREQLQTDIEVRLRKAGVTISRDARALLYTNITVVCNAQVCAYNIDLEVQQAVRLSTSAESATLLATTWKTGATGLFTGRRWDVVRDDLTVQTYRFLNAYLAANRK